MRAAFLLKGAIPFAMGSHSYYYLPCVMAFLLEFNTFSPN